MANSADQDQLASSEANGSGSTLFVKTVYPDSAGPGLTFTTLLAYAVDNKLMIFFLFFQGNRI